MSLSFASKHAGLIRLGMYVAAAILGLNLLWALPSMQKASAQNVPADSAGPSSDPLPEGSNDAPVTTAPRDKSINLLELTISGGIFMIPIFGMSALAVTMTIERFLGLRRQKVLPEGLVTGLGQMAGNQGTFDPRKAYRICQQFPSVAANVVRAMLLRVGRPLPEIETAVAQASQREADRMYANVRWLNLSASLSTMLGLIGTIQGMIMAFHQMTTMDAAADRTSVLAAGIYTALVTTFAGLAVAIPAALFSHYFEGRIQKMFREIDEMIFNLLPQLERYEGRVRFSRQAGEGNGAAEEPVPAPATAR